MINVNKRALVFVFKAYIWFLNNFSHEFFSESIKYAKPLIMRLLNQTVLSLDQGNLSLDIN